ncbi:MAG: TolC family protein [Deltaproteobacteria bacterium]|nr:TolC family protein [Deltaproteobacteria bacterium]
MAALALLSSLAVASCARPSREAAFRDVQARVEARIGQKVHWESAGGDDDAIARAVRGLFSEPLTADSAVQVALLQSPHLQRTFESLGVARAEFVQAGLLANPEGSGSLRFPMSGGGGLNVGIDVVQSLLSLFTLPARKRVAREHMESVKLEVAAAALELAAQTRQAFWDAQAAAAILRVHGDIATAADAAAELAQRVAAAGNMSELELAAVEAEAQQARVDLLQSRGEAKRTREALTRAMGASGGQVGWTMSDQLPAVPEVEPPLEALQAKALDRLEVQAARRELASRARASKSESRTRLFETLDVGASAEREPDGAWVLGPSLSLSIPLFDGGQGRSACRASKYSASARALHALRALVVAVLSELRVAEVELAVAREVAIHYRDKVVPLWERVVALSLKEYNFMLIAPFQLIQTRRDAYAAYQGYLEAVRDYWVARASLEHAIGLDLPPSPTAVEPLKPPEPAPAPDMPSHHHPEGG